jgi:hypothetical protein
MKTPKSRKNTTIVRDLMKPIYMFGRHSITSPVTEIEDALARFRAGENFYWRVGDYVYHVATNLYRATGVDDEQVARRLKSFVADNQRRQGKPRSKTTVSRRVIS